MIDRIGHIRKAFDLQLNVVEQIGDINFHPFTLLCCIQLVILCKNRGNIYPYVSTYVTPNVVVKWNCMDISHI